jgi:hypothetical protein
MIAFSANPFYCTTTKTCRPFLTLQYRMRRGAGLWQVPRSRNQNFQIVGVTNEVSSQAMRAIPLPTER